MYSMEAYCYKIEKNINKLKHYEILNFNNLEDMFEYLLNKSIIDGDIIDKDFINKIINEKYYISYQGNNYTIYRFII